MILQTGPIKHRVGLGCILKIHIISVIRAKTLTNIIEIELGAIFSGVKAGFNYIDEKANIVHMIHLMEREMRKEESAGEKWDGYESLLLVHHHQQDNTFLITNS